MCKDTLLPMKMISAALILMHTPLFISCSFFFNLVHSLLKPRIKRGWVSIEVVNVIHFLRPRRLCENLKYMLLRIVLNWIWQTTEQPCRNSQWVSITWLRFWWDGNGPYIFIHTICSWPCMNLYVLRICSKKLGISSSKCQLQMVIRNLYSFHMVIGLYLEPIRLDEIRS